MARKLNFKELTRDVTRPGTFVFPKLSSPDKKFEPEYGVFSVSVDLIGDAAEELRDLIDTTYEKEYKEECLSHGKELKKYGKPYGPALDRDKNEIAGVTRFNFKRRAGGRYGSNHSKAGQEWTASFPIYSAAGTELLKDEVWGGTVGRVSFVCVPWFTPSLGFGIRLQIEAVKVLDLVTKGFRSPTSYGFTDEDGYTVPKDTKTSNMTKDNEELDEAGDDGIDF